MNILEFQKFIEDNKLSDKTEIVVSCMTKEYIKSHLDEYTKSYFYFNGFNIIFECTWNGNYPNETIESFKELCSKEKRISDDTKFYLYDSDDNYLQDVGYIIIHENKIILV